MAENLGARILNVNGQDTGRVLVGANLGYGESDQRSLVEMAQDIRDSELYLDGDLCRYFERNWVCGDEVPQWVDEYLERWDTARLELAWLRGDHITLFRILGKPSFTNVTYMMGDLVT